MVVFQQLFANKFPIPVYEKKSVIACLNMNEFDFIFGKLLLKVKH